MNAKPISENEPVGWTAVIAMLVGLLLLAVGLVLCWFFFVRPLQSYCQSQNWTETDCQIVLSEVKDQSDSDGSSFQAIIRYQYAVGLRELTGDRICFLKATSSPRKSEVSRMVADYPTGSTARCFYDPQRPEQSVLERGFSHHIWFGLLPLILAVVGSVIYYCGYSAYASNQQKQLELSQLAQTPSSTEQPLTAPMNLFQADALDLQWDVPRKLKPASSKWLRVIGIGFFALFWNGVTWTSFFSTWDHGFNLFSLIITLFMIPFMLVGIFVVAALIHQLLSLLNPYVEIALSTGTAVVGGQFDIAWQTSAGVRRIRNLSINIEGTESATYRQGTDTKTDTQLFAVVPVLETMLPEQIKFGNAQIQIPANTMHTFEGAHNKVLWHVRVRGEIPYWPDVDEQYLFRVKPNDPVRLDDHN